MKNKKLIAMAIAGIVCVAGIAGGTLAYFTDNKTVENTITMGDVSIDLEEPKYDIDNPGGEIKDVTPNQTIEKDPTITVHGDSKPAYIRAKIVISGDNGFELPDGYAAELESNLNIQNGWVKSGDYYYYNTTVNPGESKQLFTEVKIPETWGKEVAKQSISLDVTAEAIQADNFTPARDENNNITGWFMENGTPITADNYTN